VRGLCYGRAEVEVLDVPERDLEALRAALPHPVDHAWSSPSRRCTSLAAALGGPFTIDARLAELDFGAWEGRTWEDIHRDDPVHLTRWGEDYERVAPPGGETVAALEARVRGFLEGLAPGGRHLLSTHAGVIRCLWVLVARCAWGAALERPVPHLEPITLPLPLR
jgi:alpha-ribazole phosphatase